MIRRIWRWLTGNQTLRVKSYDKRTAKTHKHWYRASSRYK